MLSKCNRTHISFQSRFWTALGKIAVISSASFTRPACMLAALTTCWQAKPNVVAASSIVNPAGLQSSLRSTVRWSSITATEVPRTTALMSQKSSTQSSGLSTAQAATEAGSETMRAPKSAAKSISARGGLWRRPASLLSRGQSAAYTMSATEQKLTQRSAAWQISSPAASQGSFAHGWGNNCALACKPAKSSRCGVFHGNA